MRGIRGTQLENRRGILFLKFLYLAFLDRIVQPARELAAVRGRDAVRDERLQPFVFGKLGDYDTLRLALLLQKGDKFAEEQFPRGGRFGEADHQKLRDARTRAFSDSRRLRRGLTGYFFDLRGRFLLQFRHAQLSEYFLGAVEVPDGARSNRQIRTDQKMSEPRMVKVGGSFENAERTIEMMYT